MEKYTITKEQIESIAQGGGKKKIKEMFPEVFETKLEVGKWYKDSVGELFYITEFINGAAYGYGWARFTFCNNGCIRNGYWTQSKKNIPATDSEVKGALIEEAKKRGFADGIKFRVNNGTDGFCECDGEFDFINNALISNGCILFKDGQWAEVIEGELASEQFLSDIIGDKWEVKADDKEHPRSVVYFKDKTPIFELERMKDGELRLRCNSEVVWEPVSEEFSLRYPQTQELIKKIVEKKLNLKDITPESAFLFYTK